MVNKFEIVCIVCFVLLTTFSAIQIHRYYSTPENEGYHSFTKAICQRDNYCCDIFFSCSGTQLLSAELLGKCVQFDSDWQDIRPISVKEKWC